MAIQYRDGSFSETMDLSEAFKKFNEALEQNTAKALYVGTPSEIEQVKMDSDLSKRLGQLEQRISDVEDGPVESENVIIPTRSEIIQFLRDKPSF